MCGTMLGKEPAPINVITKQPKYKRTNSDQRKEKSRDAARDRRAKEHQLFQDLEDSLPMSGVADSTQTAMDKTSLIRLTVAHLKCRNVVEMGLVIPEEDGKDVMGDREMLESMDAFCLILSQEMDIIYVSNNVANQIGIKSMELLGQSFYDYVHPCDHHQLKAVLNPKGEQSKEAYVRIKVTVTERGRLINLRQANYKVLKISGIARSFSGVSGVKETVFLGLAELICRDTSLQNTNLEHTGLFQTKHSPDMKFLETHNWLSTVAQYPSNFIHGMSFYEFIHAEDCQKVQKSLKNLCEQGQCEIAPYRFLVAGGGWVWIQTKANQTIAKKGSSKGCYINCTHTAISEVMNSGDVVALVQIASEKGERKNTKRKQKYENLNTTEIEKVEDIYDVLQMLDKSPKEMVDFFSPDLLDVSVTPPTPSVIVTPNKADSKCKTETFMRRASVIVSSKPIDNIVEKSEDLSFQEPQAVTTILIQNTDEPEDEGNIAEQTIVPENQDKPEQIQMQIDDGAFVSLSNAEFILEQDFFNSPLTPMSPLFQPLEYSKLNQIAPFCHELVKIEDEQPGYFTKKEQMPEFDFCDIPFEKQPKHKLNQNQMNHSEEFFRILEENTAPPKEEGFDDYSRKNDGRNPFVREDKKIMWGLNNADPELDTYFSQFSKKFNKPPPVALPNFPLTSIPFHYEPYQVEKKMMNPMWDSVMYNPPTTKPYSPPKIWSNQRAMLNRKRSMEHPDSVLQMARKDPKCSAPLFPELQKFLESQSSGTTETHDNIYITNRMENPKRIRMDSYIGPEPKHIFLLPKF